MSNPQKTEKETTEMPAKGKRKGFLFTFIALIFVLLIGFAIFVLWKNPTLLSSFNQPVQKTFSDSTDSNKQDKYIEDLTERVSYLEK